MRARARWRFGLGASLLGHAALLGAVLRAGWAPGTSLRASAEPASAGAAALEVEVLASAASAPSAPSIDADAAAPRATPSSPPSGGAPNEQNIDAPNAGEGGDGASAERGRVLADRALGVNLATETMNTLRAAQEHRLRTARDRASPQQRRATPNPAYDPWLSSAHGVLLFRVPDAPALPAPGLARAPSRPVLAGAAALDAQGTPAPDDTLARREAPAREVLHAGGATAAGAGVREGLARNPSRVAGPAAFGRPSIDRGRASTTAPAFDPRPRDDVDAEALATSLVRNALSASVQQGVRDAVAGRGGVGGGGDPGSGGGRGAGGRARPYGEGSGPLALDAPDARYLRYFQQLRRSIDALWADAFPRDEMLELRQGTVIVHFTVLASGRVAGVRVHRRSGVERFDRNVASALASAQLPPIPPELERSSLQISAPFVFRNPIVH